MKEQNLDRNDTSRLSRLTSIIIRLQTKKLITATFLAGKFNVSVPTHLPQYSIPGASGIPILTEDGKGYT